MKLGSNIKSTDMTNNNSQFPCLEPLCCYLLFGKENSTRESQSDEKNNNNNNNENDDDLRFHEENTDDNSSLNNESSVNNNNDDNDGDSKKEQKETIWMLSCDTNRTNNPVGLSRYTAGNLSNEQRIGEWKIIPNDNATPTKSFALESMAAPGHFLSCDASGSVTVAERNDRWEQWRFSSNNSSVIQLVSVAFPNLALAAIDLPNNYKFVQACPTDMPIATLWNLQKASGELCFLSNVKTNKQLFCHAMASTTVGNFILGTADMLQLSDARGGWEVWRFIHLQQNQYFISSWTHSNIYLVCDQHGKVFPTKDKTHPGAVWSIHKTMKAFHSNNDNDSIYDHGTNSHEDEDSDDVEHMVHITSGVVIQSVEYKRFLNAQQDYEGNYIVGTTLSNDDDEDSVLWHLDAAHSNSFHLASAAHENKFLSATSSLSSSSNQVTTDHEHNDNNLWHIKKSDGGYFTISTTTATNNDNDDDDDSLTETKYLASTQSGQVYTIEEADVSTNEEQHLWEIEINTTATNNNGSNSENAIFIISKLHDRVLSCDAQGDLTTTGTDYGDWEMWSLQPKLPSSLSKTQIIDRVKGVATVALAAVDLPMAALFAGLNFGLSGNNKQKQRAAVMSEEAMLAGMGVEVFDDDDDDNHTNANIPLVGFCVSQKNDDKNNNPNEETSIVYHHVCNWRKWPDEM